MNMNDEKPKFLKNIKKLNKNSKNNQFFNQKSINLVDKQILQKEFYEWVCGIQEDNPLPLEVKYIYYCFDILNNDIVLSYSGDENLLSVFELGFYAPLEAQYFNSNVLKKYSKKIFEANKFSLLKNIYNMLKSIVTKTSKRLWFLKDKKILFGKMFDKIKV